MNLDGAARIAAGGLANIDRQLALISQNVANADTPDYARQVSTQSNLTADGRGLGVLSGPSARKVDETLQAALFAQDGAVEALSVTQARLSAIDAVHGTPGAGDDLSSRLGTLRDGFAALLTDPASQAGQNQVTAAADTLVRRVNTLHAAYGKQRQGAHDDAVAALGALSRGLDAIGALNNRIVALRAAGAGTADLENQRDAALHSIASLVSIKALVREDGSMLVVTAGGLALPTREAATALTLAAGNLQSGTYYPDGGLGGVMLRGQDVTAQMTGGRIGADLVLRDRTLPVFQAELDEFSAKLAQRFAVQGLALFTDPDGAVPAGGGTPAQSGYVGFAGTIRVNPDVVTQPSLVRDGTDSIADSPTGATAFTPNPADGPAGFTALIRRVLDQTFGAEVRAGVAHPAAGTTALGPAGNLVVPYAAPATLADFATAVVAAQAGTSADTTDRLGTEQALRDRLADRHRTVSGVNLDAEMANMLTLQTAYGATARVLTVVRSLLDELMSALR
jgi:flagellar hook-associated protein 1 FlgK